MSKTVKPDARSLERKRQLGLCSRDVRGMAKMMLKGKDQDRMAAALGVAPITFKAKIANGRFTAAEFCYLADLCGYKIFLEEKPLINGIKV